MQQFLNSRQDNRVDALEVAVGGSRRKLLENLSKFRVSPRKETLDIDNHEGGAPGIESDGCLLFLPNYFLDLLVFGHVRFSVNQ
jgi:hypothetical protein